MKTDSPFICGGGCLGMGWELLYSIITYLCVTMAQRITVYIEDDLLKTFDAHRGLVKRSTAISELMKSNIRAGGGTIE